MRKCTRHIWYLAMGKGVIKRRKIVLHWRRPSELLISSAQLVVRRKCRNNERRSCCMLNNKGL